MKTQLPASETADHGDAIESPMQPVEPPALVGLHLDSRDDARHAVQAAPICSIGSTRPATCVSVRVTPLAARGSRRPWPGPSAASARARGAGASPGVARAGRAGSLPGRPCAGAHERVNSTRVRTAVAEWNYPDRFVSRGYCLRSELTHVNSPVRWRADTVGR